MVKPHMKKKIFLYILVFFVEINAIFAQSAVSAEPDFMRSMGKMNVVIGVILILFFGIAFYLIRLDRNLTKLENQIKENQKQ
jgi:hypothetical protein